MSYNNRSRDPHLQEYLRNKRVARVSLSRHDLVESTDVVFFMSSNFANLVSYIAVLGVTICVGFFGLGRDVKGSYLEISSKYETLLSPIYWYIPSTWGLIFLSEGIFITFSFLNSYSHTTLIQEGVGFYFFFVNCCHIGWMISYCFDVLWLAVAWLALTIVFLMRLNQKLYKQGHIDEAPRFLDQNNTLPQSRPEEVDNQQGEPLTLVYEWFVFRMPFQLHLGWLLFTILLNFNEMAIALNWKFTSELVLCSLIAMWLLGLFVLFYPKYPIFVIPLAIAWAAVGVWVNLRNPSQILFQRFSERTIARMKGGIIATSFEHGIITVIRFIYFLANSYRLLEKEPR